jgi:hypothetical protein
VFLYLTGEGLDREHKVGYGRVFDRVVNEQGIDEARSLFIHACRSAQRGDCTLHYAIREGLKDAFDWYGHIGEQEYSEALKDRDVPRTSPGMTLAFLGEQVAL